MWHEHWQWLMLMVELPINRTSLKASLERDACDSKILEHCILLFLRYLLYLRFMVKCWDKEVWFCLVMDVLMHLHSRKRITDQGCDLFWSEKWSACKGVAAGVNWDRAGRTGTRHLSSPQIAIITLNASYTKCMTKISEIFRHIKAILHWHPLVKSLADHFAE